LSSCISIYLINIYTTYRCGDCPPGYTGDGKTCIDVDECLDDARCGHRCINSPGSYVCACFQGHELNENGATCDGSIYNTYMNSPYSCKIIVIVN